MERKHIPLATPTMHGEEMAYIQEAFDRNWIAPLGFNCDRFEEEIATRLTGEGEARKYALSLSSGTAALHLAVKMAGVGPGDVVLCADKTFIASVAPVLYEGGTPVLVDSERETWNMDPAALKRAFEKYPHAKAVIPVHLYGVPAKMDEIRALCRQYGATLIEDAAEALSATYRGQQCGSLGDFGVLSFNGNKIITTSGGGVLVTSDAEKREKAFFYATQARENAPWYEHKEIGYNYRMSNIVAGIGRGQLLHLAAHRARKEEIYTRYREGLADLPVSMNPYLADTAPNFWLSCLLVDKGCAVTPAVIHAALAAADIESRYSWRPMHMQEAFAKYEYITAGGSSVSEDLFTRALCLPSDIKMTEEEQDRVIKTIRACF